MISDIREAAKALFTCGRDALCNPRQDSPLRRVRHSLCPTLVSFASKKKSKGARTMQFFVLLLLLLLLSNLMAIVVVVVVAVELLLLLLLLRGGRNNGRQKAATLLHHFDCNFMPELSLGRHLP